MKLFWKNKPKDTKPKDTKPEDTKLEWNEERDRSVIYHMCPECGSFPIMVMYTCHTFMQNDKWMSCMPCDSAGDLYCPNEECNWGYTWGLNPNNPRSDSNEKYKPDWLVGKWPH